MAREIRKGAKILKKENKNKPFAIVETQSQAVKAAGLNFPEK